MYLFVCLFVCLLCEHTIHQRVAPLWLIDRYIRTCVRSYPSRSYKVVVQHPWRCDPQLTLISVLYSIAASLPSFIAALFSYLTDESICLIPCEFCDKQLSLSQIHSHQVRHALSYTTVVHPHQISMHTTPNCSCSTASLSIMLILSF